MTLTYALFVFTLLALAALRPAANNAAPGAARRSPAMPRATVRPGSRRD